MLVSFVRCVEVELASLPAADLGVEQVTGIAKAYLFAVSNLDFLGHFQLVVKDQVYFDCTLKSDRNDWLRWVQPHRNHFLPFSFWFLVDPQ